MKGIALDSTNVPAVSGVVARDRLNAGIRAARKTTVIAAGVGFVLGGGATWAILHSGGSTAPCDRDANQDAMRAGECIGITVLGGAAGALVGALVAGLL
jgi:hypothetical protein